jgi:hypothetical protein
MLMYPLFFYFVLCVVCSVISADLYPLCFVHRVSFLCFSHFGLLILFVCLSSSWFSLCFVCCMYLPHLLVVKIYNLLAVFLFCTHPLRCILRYWRPRLYIFCCILSVVFSKVPRKVALSILYPLRLS